MVADKKSLEQVLVEVCDGEEWRRLSVIAGPSLAVTEVTQGPVTEAAYGELRHGHKILCDYQACARVLGSPESDVGDALAQFFAGSDGEVLLSDLMDAFDAVGERYTYAAWGGDGAAVFRPAGDA